MRFTLNKWERTHLTILLMNDLKKSATQIKEMEKEIAAYSRPKESKLCSVLEWKKLEQTKVRAFYDRSRAAKK